MNVIRKRLPSLIQTKYCDGIRTLVVGSGGSFGRGSFGGGDDSGFVMEPTVPRPAGVDGVDGGGGPSASSGTKKQRYSRQQKRDRKQAHPHDDNQVHSANTATTATAAAARQTQQQQQQQQHKRNRSTPTTPTTGTPSFTPSVTSWQDRIFQCIRDAEATGSIDVEGQGPPPPMPFPQTTTATTTTATTTPHHHHDGNTHLDRIRVVTSCELRSHHRRRQSGTLSPAPAPGLTVHVQPLLILDLNGILCHRSRPHREPPGVQLRQPFLGRVAGTPLVGRTDLGPLLHMLDQYFCLAVWTSAKAKTAKGLLNLLVPPEIQRRLLFVWAQHDCHAVVPKEDQEDDNNYGDSPTLVESDFPSDERMDEDRSGNTHHVTHKAGNASDPPYKKKHYKGEDVLYEKHLDQVWRKFPLWNVNNTLLIDDSPDKCPFALANAIHPPPIHGQSRPPCPGPHHLGIGIESPSSWVLDEENEQQQYHFFQQYIHHWHQYPYVEELTESTVPTPLPRSTTRQKKDSKTSSSLEPVVLVREDMTNRPLYDFLQQTATGHMGWRGGGGGEKGGR